MIEVYLSTSPSDESSFQLNASILPHGGIGGLAKDSVLGPVPLNTFQAAYKACSKLDLSKLSFTPNENRWPVPGPKFQIVNTGSHAEREKFGNYQVFYEGEVIGEILNFPRGKRGELILAALKVVREVGL